jgi:allophanate hydrolase
METLSLDIQRLRQHYEQHTLCPSQLVEILYRRMETATVDNIWISLLSLNEALAQAQRLEDADMDALPLYGIPFAIKDNFDYAGYPTTVGCPDFAYLPEVTATAVDKLLAAGAILIGKCNLDQFATGLVGTRSPYGAVANPFDPAYIAGGSSSGSAVAVAAGLVSFALGSDTAGSGRVPAGFNNVVGLKPTRGLVSTAGLFPACRSLDCVSIFALTCEDARRVLDVVEGFDDVDPYSRARPSGAAPLPARDMRVGVPAAEQLRFFGNDAYAACFAQAVDDLKALGATVVEIDFSPFNGAGQLLYQGPWVAERYAAIQEFITARPQSMLPVTREIIGQGKRYTAVDLFQASYLLQAYRQAADLIWQEIDCLVTPTAGTHYMLSDVAADPLGTNSNLGHYTNFVNLLDLSALAVPAGFTGAGLPFGITLIAPAFGEEKLHRLGAQFQQRLQLPLGATGWPMPAAL